MQVTFINTKHLLVYGSTDCKQNPFLPLMTYGTQKEAIKEAKHSISLKYTVYNT